MGALRCTGTVCSAVSINSELPKRRRGSGRLQGATGLVPPVSRGGVGPRCCCNGSSTLNVAHMRTVATSGSAHWCRHLCGPGRREPRSIVCPQCSRCHVQYEGCTANGWHTTVTDHRDDSDTGRVEGLASFLGRLLCLARCWFSLLFAFSLGLLLSIPDAQSNASRRCNNAQSHFSQFTYLTDESSPGIGA